MIHKFLGFCFEQICPEVVESWSMKKPGETFQELIDRLSQRTDDKDIAKVVAIFNRMNELDEDTLKRFAMEFERELLHSKMLG